MAVNVTIPGGAGNLTIDYGYDPLGRLTSADYSDDTSYAYTYDAVGNRMTQVISGISTTYGYDDANPLKGAGGSAHPEGFYMNFVKATPFFTHFTGLHPSRLV